METPKLISIELSFSVCVCARSVLGHRCCNDQAKQLPTSDDEKIFPEDTCGAINDVRLTLMQRYFKEVGT